MGDLNESRKRIGEIDKEMARLFEERMKAVEDVVSYKMNNGLSVKDSTREEELINKNRSYIEDKEIESYYVQLIRKVIDLSCDYQEKIMSGLKVAFSGTLGAFAHIAAKQMFPQSTYIPYPGFEEAYNAVEKGEVDVAVLPLENSYAGEVGGVLDLVFSGSLYVNQVIDVPIQHNLIGIPGASMADIKEVVSHPQALEQCKNFITSHDYKTIPYSNTALAAEYVRDLNDKSVAAIASTVTADLYDLEVIEPKTNDSGRNVTRFGAFSRVANEPNKSGKKRMDENFILVFTVKDEAGALVHALNILAAHGYSMRSLRSRPMKELQWKYFFYIEVEGNVHTQNGQDMLREMSAMCAKLKVAGSFMVKEED